MLQYGPSAEAGTMRTLIVVAIGLVLSVGFVFTASHLGKDKVIGAIVFISLWLIFCCFDYANGVKAGYSAVDELGVHILLFVLPALGAWLAARFLS
jgi:hypothetical protein